MAAHQRPGGFKWSPAFYLWSRSHDLPRDRDELNEDRVGATDNALTASRLRASEKSAEVLDLLTYGGKYELDRIKRITAHADSSPSHALRAVLIMRIEKKNRARVGE